MPEQFLHATNIGPAIQQVRCKAVPKRMRCGAAVQAADFEMFFQHSGDAPRGEASPELFDEHRRGRPGG